MVAPGHTINIIYSASSSTEATLMGLLLFLACLLEPKEAMTSGHCHTLALSWHASQGETPEIDTRA